LDEKLDVNWPAGQADRRSKSESRVKPCAANFPSSDSGLLRREAMPTPAAAGYLTDEDVFRDVS